MIATKIWPYICPTYVKRAKVRRINKISSICLTMWDANITNFTNLVVSLVEQEINFDGKYSLTFFVKLLIFGI
jgi:hypothetical protein